MATDLLSKESATCSACHTVFYEGPMESPADIQAAAHAYKEHQNVGGCK